MSEREALDLYEAVRYNLPHPRLKEAVHIANLRTEPAPITAPNCGAHMTDGE